MRHVKLFIDTEFNGFGGELISMALVSETGKDWYEVLPPPPVYNDWVFENVVPVLNKAPIRREAFRSSLHTFLKQYDEPVIVADWYTDLMHFFACMAGKDHSKSFNFGCLAALLEGVPDLKPVTRHNALSDAYALKHWYMENLDNH